MPTTICAPPADRVDLLAHRRAAVDGHELDARGTCRRFELARDLQRELAGRAQHERLNCGRVRFTRVVDQRQAERGGLAGARARLHDQVSCRAWRARRRRAARASDERSRARRRRCGPPRSKAARRRSGEVSFGSFGRHRLRSYFWLIERRADVFGDGPGALPGARQPDCLIAHRVLLRIAKLVNLLEHAQGGGIARHTRFREPAGSPKRGRASGGTHVSSLVPRQFRRPRPGARGSTPSRSSRREARQGAAGAGGLGGQTWRMICPDHQAVAEATMTPNTKIPKRLPRRRTRSPGSTGWLICRDLLAWA